MAKPEWGAKRVCQGCGTKFYDFGRSPIECPKCGAAFDPEALLKSRRPRPGPPARVVKPVKEVVAEAPELDEEGLDEDVDLDLEEGDEDLGDISESDEDDDLIEDASDLDGDGVAEVVVTSDEDED